MTSTDSSTDSRPALFSSLNLTEELLDTISALDYQAMTVIQTQSLPAILSGEDILAQAKTGSGKTAAFAIGILQQLQLQDYQTQAVVLCPTRELADQVSREMRLLARAMPNTSILTLCGGKPMAAQLVSLQRPPHVVVGTPGRLLKHLQKGSLKLDTLKILVLDEADRMLDMGFYEDIMVIIGQIPQRRQTLLFSATYPDEINNISKNIQHNPLEIRVESLHDDVTIKQIFYEIGRSERSKALLKLLQYYQPQSCVVFCNRKQQCQEVADELNQHGFHALALHGDLEQKQRDEVLVQFANNSSSVLIATDVAARGLDIKDLQAVITYELSPDPEIHIHRIGRTGRAGKEGLALSLFTASETPKVIAIENAQHSRVRIEELSSLQTDKDFVLLPAMVTLCIQGGRRDKVRAGDILGALTADNGLSAKQIGKINIFDRCAYVAIEQAASRQALKILVDGKIKGRRFRVRKLL